MATIKLLSKILLIFYISISTVYTPTKSAEELAFVNGLFSRKLKIKELEKFIETGKAKGFLKDIIKHSNSDKEKFANLLKEEFELPLVVTSRLMNSKIGEIIISRVGKIIYPIKINDDSITIPAIRSAVIKGIVVGKGKINLLLFLQSFPNKVVALNIPALLSIIDKVESISELIEFFSDSPLDRLKKTTRS